MCWGLSFLATKTTGAAHGLFEGSIICWSNSVLISSLKNSLLWWAGLHGDSLIGGASFIGMACTSMDILPSTSSITSLNFSFNLFNSVVWISIRLLISSVCSFILSLSRVMNAAGTGDVHFVMQFTWNVRNLFPILPWKIWNVTSDTLLEMG